MAERGLFLDQAATPNPDAPAGFWPWQNQVRRPADAPLTEPERNDVENSFETYFNMHYANLADTEWSPAEKVRQVTFQYAYERHIAQRYHEMGHNEFTRWMQQHVFSVGEHQREGTVKWGRVIERGVNWGREIGVGALTGTTAKVGVATTVAPAIGHFLNIAGGPAAWVTGAVAGGVAGGIMGFRRAGERYVTKNLGAQKLTEEFAPGDLINLWETWAESQHDEKTTARPGDPRYNPRHEPEAEGAVSAGRELPSDFYNRVAETLAHLDEIVQAGMLRGDWQDRANLADKRAKLAAILETHTFFTEQAQRNEELHPYYVGLETGDAVTVDQVVRLWTDLQEHRTRESRNERFNQGCSERARQFVADQRRQARSASWKGAGIGALSGAVLGGIFSHFLGGHHDTHTTPSRQIGVPEGYGGGEVDAQRALDHAMHSGEFGSLTRLIENQAYIDPQHLSAFDHDQLNLVNNALRSHHLSNLGHYFDSQTGHNAVFDLVIRAGKERLTPGQTEAALYNFLSHYDHNVGMSLQQWHTALASEPVSHMINVDWFAQQHQLYVDRLLMMGQIHTVGEHTTDIYTPAAAGELTYDTLMGQGVIPALAGHAAGDMVGQFATPNKDFHDTAKPRELNAEYAASFGKQLPQAGQTWELRHGATNYNRNNLFRDANGRVPEHDVYFRVNRVDGSFADITIVNPPPNWSPMRVNFKVNLQDLIEQKAFQLHEDAQQRQSREQKELDDEAKQKVAEDEARHRAEQDQIREWERTLPNTAVEHFLVFRVSRIQQNRQAQGQQANRPRYEIRLASTPIDSTTGWPITIINPNEVSVLDEVNAIVHRQNDAMGDYTLRARLVITHVDGATKKIDARIESLI